MYVHFNLVQLFSAIIEHFSLFVNKKINFLLTFLQTVFELFIDKITKKNYNVDTQKIRSERGLPDAELRLCALADT